VRLGLRLQMIKKQEDDDMAKGRKANGQLKKGYTIKNGRTVKAKGRK